MAALLLPGHQGLLALGGRQQGGQPQRQPGRPGEGSEGLGDDITNTLTIGDPSESGMGGDRPGATLPP